MMKIRPRKVGIRRSELIVQFNDASGTQVNLWLTRYPYLYMYYALPRNMRIVRII